MNFACKADRGESVKKFRSADIPYGQLDCGAGEEKKLEKRYTFGEEMLRNISRATHTLRVRGGRS